MSHNDYGAYQRCQADAEERPRHSLSIRLPRSQHKATQLRPGAARRTATRPPQRSARRL